MFRRPLYMLDPEPATSAAPIKDVTIPDTAPNTLLMDKHISYIAAYGDKKDDYEYCLTEYLRMSGIYWGLTAMDLMHALDKMQRDEVLDFVKKCQHECGGISASIGHDPHLLYTLSAIQAFLTLHTVPPWSSSIVLDHRSDHYHVLCLYDAMDTIDVDRVVKYTAGLQQDDGSFFGDKWGEVDTRFSFCAVACLSLLNRLDAIDTEKAVDFVLSCMNFDGGFGSRPGSESHSGQIYCCIGMLSILEKLHHVNVDMLGWWLCERQLPSGGLNGRPEKLPDVCYSWWVLASLKVIGKLHWIDKKKLIHFILASQDDETGGIADRPGDIVDPFHTLFGVAGLSLLGYEDIKTVNPVYCMPEYIIRRLDVQPQILS
ncbi:hypothetical protein LSH36_330g05008 [Paralvinella palmiformis]|uniref:Geranylgeranyl transferase type-2 subunit beta n=1 Tax=Paralvinella palmiformis TaxID=53620 RepID=A0AAD9N300_9ANNE|nr:hypothetical protein LSH36_330g05008 [Paralvinella palmiformis]